MTDHEETASLDAIIKEWCRETNRKNGVHLHAFAAVGSVVGGIVLADVFAMGFLDFIGVSIAVVFAFKALQRRWSVAFLRTRSPGPHIVPPPGDHLVPDSLLAKIADHPDIPANMKASIADQLAKYGEIAFDTLFEIHDTSTRCAMTEARRAAPGYRAMTAFATTNPSKEAGS